MSLRYLAAFASVAILLTAASCRAPDGETASEQPPAATSGDIAVVSADAGFVDIIARDFAFDAPDELRPGWTTFRLVNEGNQEHFMAISRLPEGKTTADHMAENAPAFHLEPYLSGEMDREQFLGHVASQLPEWFGSIVAAGGPGFVAPGEVSETTVYLEPGTYSAECYVKTADHQFHVDLGMIHQITVTGEPTDAEPPEYDIEMTLTNYDIAWEGDLTAGSHTARIQYLDDPEGFLKHDVHLVRLEDDVSVDEVAQWMDWIDGLTAPAPARFEGGSDGMPGGGTAYFTFDLEPGAYAWISEGYAAQGMLKTFTVE
jgi:hypothetical protein